VRLPALLAVLVCVVLAVAAISDRACAEPFAPGQSFNPALIAQVTGTALAFMAPRTLDAIPIPQMTLWGLRGLTTLDGRFTPELRDGSLRLLSNSVPLLVRPPPPDDDAAAWGEAAAQLTRAAWDTSEAVRRAGNGGVVRTFFDELFNHFDPYSRYTPPGEAEEERERRNGRAGIGVTIAPAGGGFVIRNVFADGPAAQSGIRAGDAILAIDDQSTQGADLAAVNAMIDGADGTPITVTVRDRGFRAHAITMRRARVPPETVTASRAGETLVLRVSGFSSDTAARLSHELTRGLANPRSARGVVLDLRGNRGGLLREAVAAADTLMTKGTVAVTVGRDPEADHQFVADGNDIARGLPVVVVVDGRSASSAEILAAALADQRRAVVVGSSTLGKGLVQTILTLPDGGDLYLTWSRVLAPLGWPIQGLGVLPQVCTSLGEVRLASQLAALGEGREELAPALRRHRDARAPITPSEILEIRDACPAAEGRDDDMRTARFLITHRLAYDTALLPSPGP
jgi:carboxyl-terminal processing protease